MTAYFVTSDKNVGFDKIDWQNIICLSKDKDTCIQSRDEFVKDGLVVSVDMNDGDVVNAVSACMHGNSCTVRCKVLEVVA